MSQWVDLKVGFSCNNQCVHCVISDKIEEKDLNLSDIKLLLNEYIDQYKSINLTLTGGEVTIRKDFVNLMDFIEKLKNEKKINFVDIQTNARMLSNDYLLKSTYGVVDFFLIALHSHLEKTHDIITSKYGSYRETVNAIEKIVALNGNDSIAIQTVISKYNYENLIGIYELCLNKFKIHEYNITFPHPVGRCFSRDVVPTYGDVQPYINATLSYCLQRGINPYIEALPYCVFYKEFRNYALEFYKKRAIHVVGYAGEKDGKIDYQELASQGHSMYSSCRNCSLQSECEGVWMEYKNLYPEEDLNALFKD